MHKNNVNMHGLFINFVHFIIQICGQILHYYFTFKCISFTQFSSTVLLQNLTHYPILQNRTVHNQILVKTRDFLGFRLHGMLHTSEAGSTGLWRGRAPGSQPQPWSARQGVPWSRTWTCARTWWRGRTTSLWTLLWVGRSPTCTPHTHGS